MRRSRPYGQLLAGVALLLVGGLVGLNPGALDAVLHGPVVVRVALAAAAGLVGVWYLLSAVARLAGQPLDHADGRSGAEELTAPGKRPFAEMVRGVRYVFLAIAALAVGASFIVGHPLPLVIGLIIAGVDIVETSFLFLVDSRGGDSSS